MFIVRPVKTTDLDKVMKLISVMHSGIISLPKNRNKIAQKIEKSIDSFSKEVSFPKDEIYLFVLENTESKQIGGISGIYAKTGTGSPTYFYKLKEEISHSDRIELPIQQLLIVDSISGGPTENCSLFLHPRYRRDGLGKLLSFSRFLFMASFRNRFCDRIIANLRGVFKSNGKCPFWDSIGRHFLNVEYDTLQDIISEDPYLVPVILPKHPCYLSLLPDELRNVIGQPHKNSAPALNMLKNEGFKLINKFDLFDGGPSVDAAIDEIHFIKHHDLSEIASIQAENKSAEKVIVCNNSINFRAAYAHINPSFEGKTSLSKRATKALRVDIGDTVRYSSSNRRRSHE